jgi:hypothetical protein
MTRRQYVCNLSGASTTTGQTGACASPHDVLVVVQMIEDLERRTEPFALKKKGGRSRPSKAVILNQSL